MASNSLSDTAMAGGVLKNAAEVANFRSKPIVAIRNVVKRFGPLAAVDGLSLDIFEGEFFALLGGSGCGKTTLLRMLAGFEHADSGKIEIDSVDVSRIPAYRRPTNMVFQSYALFPHMSVERNVAFGLKQDGCGGVEIARRVEEALTLVDMVRHAKAKPHQLSGGQKQRTALARAVAKKPRILLLDEPMAALDKNLREATQQELKKLQEQLGITFIIVTHDQDEAMSLASRIGLMRSGKLEQTGAPSEVYNRPCNAYVARFFGSINLLDGTVTSKSKEMQTIDSAAAATTFRVVSNTAAGVGATVKVGIRPEHIEITSDPDVSMPNTMTGMIESASYLGNSTAYRVRLGNGLEMRVIRPNLSRAGREYLDLGSAVRLGFSPENCIVLNQ